MFFLATYIDKKSNEELTAGIFTSAESAKLAIWNTLHAGYQRLFMWRNDGKDNWSLVFKSDSGDIPCNFYVKECSGESITEVSTTGDFYSGEINLQRPWA